MTMKISLGNLALDDFTENFVEEYSWSICTNIKYTLGMKINILLSIRFIIINIFVCVLTYLKLYFFIKFEFYSSLNIFKIRMFYIFL